MDTRLVESFLRSAGKTGKVSYGFRETLKSMKGTKVVVVSQSLQSREREMLIQSCRSFEVPIIQYEGTSIMLGRAAGVSYPVKVLGVRSAGEADLSKLLNMAEKSVSSQKI
ncbi:MAG: ribosomal L7Ae/L30e/S12e/Gadd45 family protein [Conexivisphaerales archaeon]